MAPLLWIILSVDCDTSLYSCNSWSQFKEKSIHFKYWFLHYLETPWFIRTDTSVNKITLFFFKLYICKVFLSHRRWLHSRLLYFRSCNRTSFMNRCVTTPPCPHPNKLPQYENWRRRVAIWLIRCLSELGPKNKDITLFTSEFESLRSSQEINLKENTSPQTQFLASVPISSPPDHQKKREKPNPGIEKLKYKHRKDTLNT